MRMFLAINFEESVRENIVASMELLKSLSVKGRFIQEENVHLTLVFFGEIMPERVETIIKVMERVPCNGMFSIKFSEAGVFKKRGGNIWWIGIEDSEELISLQGFLMGAFIKEGFTLENRVFNPHLTLGRGIALKEGLEISEFQRNLKSFSAQVKRISLMKSERLDGKLTYTEVYGKQLL